MLQAVGVSREHMCMEQWEKIQRTGKEAITQTIGRLAWERKFDGLLVPSAARASGVNLVAFPDHTPRGCIEIYNSDELPPY